MPILTLINRVNSKYIKKPHPIISKKVSVKRSYLTGIALQALGDGSLDREEEKHFLELARFFNVREDIATTILDEAASPSERIVADIRENLIDSKFKYYFILDLQIMAHQDFVVKNVETQIIDKYGELLDIETEDVRFFTQLADAVVEKDPAKKERWLRAFINNGEISDQSDPEDFSYYTDDSNFES